MLYINETEIKVRYAETDQMGIVHHSNYYVWFEVGRTEFITFSGMSYSEMESRDILIPLIDSYCKYIEPARYGDEVIIRTFIEDMSSVKVKFKYEVVRKSDRKLLAEGATTHVFVDRNLKIMNLRKKHTEVWNLINDLFAGIDY